MDYKNFDLSFYAGEGGTFIARLLNSPGGEAEQRFTLPFSPLEAAEFSHKVLRRQESLPAAREFGQRLFEAVFADALLSRFEASLAHTSEADQGLRVLLRLNNLPALSQLPWEYLYRPGVERFVGLSVRTPIVRYPEVPEHIRPQVIDGPLRILVIIASPEDHPPLNVKAEWAQLQAGLGELIQQGKVILERLPTAAERHLQGRLRGAPVHVLHFIGHGIFDDAQGEGAVLFEAEGGRSRPVYASTLGELLHDHASLRLAFLNACEGAEHRHDLFSGVAQKLVQQAIPAAIGMQFPVSDAAALTLSQVFYSALADGYPVDAAITEARKGVSAQHRTAEWGTPVLYMRAEHGQLFARTASSEAGTGQKPAGSSVINVGGDYVAGDQIIHGDKIRGSKHSH